MNQEDQRYLDSLTKEELIQERAINQSLILARLYSLPPNYPLLSQQEKEEYNRENQRLIDKKELHQEEAPTPNLRGFTKTPISSNQAPPKQIKPLK